MKLHIYQVDAFSDKLFSGNPAAVVPLESWLPEKLMQAIANENNLSETAYFVHEEDGIHLRWFTPSVEVDLCGHATLATAHVLFSEMNWLTDTITFHTNSGPLTVTRNGDRLVMDFPIDTPNRIPITTGITDALGRRPIELYKGKDDVMAVFGKEETVKELHPDMHALAQLKARGVIVTAPGQEVDFVSRFFGPRAGIPEDPVTGSAHTLLAPYWAERLEKDTLSARQVSFRGGSLWCRVEGDRVMISGSAATYMTGTILLS